MSKKTSKEETQTLGEIIDDASITSQVELVLLYHKSASVLNTWVEMNNGFVNISGKTRNAAEKDFFPNWSVT